MKLHQANYANIQFTKGLLADRIALAKDVIVPFQYELLNDRVPGAVKSYAVRNFKLAAKVLKGQTKKAEHKGFIFQDSDIAKWLEAAAYSLAGKPDKALEKKCDRLIELVGAAQHKDGYINTYYTITGQQRWSDLLFGHELYCAGHFIEAAVAYYEATGKKRLLEIMCRFADLLCETFGRGKNKLRSYPGHQEVELALIRLYTLTGKKKYLTLAKYFIDERGRRYNGKISFESERHFTDRQTHVAKMLRTQGFEYCQGHAPVREQKTVEGHAVRAVYMLCAMADIAGQTDDKTLLKACRTLWRNLVDRRMYITGGIGSTKDHEGFTRDYDLPNHTAYAETCAAIGLLFWANRMLNLELNSDYADIMEKALYNGILSSVALDGKHFFYSNRLACDPDMPVGGTGTDDNIRSRRPEWFGCACCPPNLARLLCSLGRYSYSSSDDRICVHLYGQSRGQFHLKKISVLLEQKTAYPWKEKIQIIVRTDQPTDFTLQLRLPGWCRKPAASLNGKKITLKDKIKNGYLSLKRCWEKGDVIELTFPMPVETVYSHPAVTENAGRVAIQRGPVVYCLEQVDNSCDLDRIVIPEKAKWTVRYDKHLLGGCCVIKGAGLVTENSSSSLYYTDKMQCGKAAITAIPYHLWANRESGKMAVWIRSKQ